MKKNILLFSFLFFAFLSIKAQKNSSTYNDSLAKVYGGDDYGMKPYVLVILKTGTSTPANKTLTDSLFRGHMNNIGRLAKEGKLIVAGPLKKNDKNYRGIFILNVKTIEEAQALVNTDPAVSNHLLEAEFYGWYGSAALPAYLKVHEQIEKEKH